MHMRQLNGSGATQSAQSKRAESPEASRCFGGCEAVGPTSLSMLSDATLAGFTWEYGQPIPGARASRHG